MKEIMNTVRPNCLSRRQLTVRTTEKGFFKLEKAMAASAVFISTLLSGFAETTHTWSGSTDTSPATAASWMDANNWSPAVVPNDGDSAAVLPTHEANYFVRVDSPITVAHVRGSSDAAARNIVFGEGPVTMKYPEYNECMGYGYFFTPVIVDKVAGLWTRAAYFCDDITAVVGPVFPYYGDAYFCFDRYSRSPDTTRYASIGGIRCCYGRAHFYAPRTYDADQVANFDVTEGSPYIYNRSPYSALYFVSAGGIVRGSGIGEGTYVKRIFNEKWLELSQPAVGTAVDTPVTFVAHSQKMHVDVGLVRGYGTGLQTELLVNRYGSSDAIDVEIGEINLESEGEQLSIASHPVCLPGRTIIHTVNTQEGNLITLGESVILLSDSEHVDGPGFPHNTVSCSGTSHIAVTNSMTATIGRLAELSGSIVKEGSGRLSIGISGGLAGGGNGQITVREGALNLVVKDVAAAPAIKRLEVVSGATFCVSKPGIQVGTLVVEEGATICGPGVIFTGDAIDITGVRLMDGGGVETASSSTYLREPEESFPSSARPAFWVDASDINTMEIVRDESTGRAYVRQWNDVRGSGYNYAISPVPESTAKMPWLLFGVDGSSAVTSDERQSYPGSKPLAIHFECDDIARNASQWQNDPTRTLVWSQPVHGIRAVFQVLDAGYRGGGYYLGATPRLAGHYDDFLRAIDIYSETTSALFYPGGDFTEASRNGEFRIDGVAYDAASKPYPYGGYPVSGVPDRIVPAVTSLRPDGTTARGYPSSDSFDVNVNNGQCHGKKRLCELIVFTNDVTEADFKAITGYLTKKWQNCRIDFTPGMRDGSTLGTIDVSSAATVGASAGTTMTIEGVSGSGTLRKCGEGTLVVRDFVHPQVSLVVDAGTLEVSSVDPQPVAGAFLHLDATKGVTENDLGVTTWTDARGAGYPVAQAISETSAGLAHVEANALNGLPVVDFGAPKDLTGYETAGCGMRLSQKSNAQHTLITVWGSQNGGGVLLGSGDEDYLSGYGILRGSPFLGTSSSDAIFMSGARPGTIDKEFASKTYLNCSPVSALTSGLTGGYDTLVYRGVEPFGLAAISSAAKNAMQGGQKIGEYLVYPWGLSESEIGTVRAYLEKKWYGIEGGENNRAAAVASVAVASGATLRLVGGAPMSVSLISSGIGGTVDGSLVSSENAVIDVVVNSDGTISPLNVSGALDLSHGGTVRVTGNLRALQPGAYPILRSSSTRGGNWQIATETSSSTKKSLSVRVKGNDLCLVVKRSGSLVSLF